MSRLEICREKEKKICGQTALGDISNLLQLLKESGARKISS